MKKYFNISIFVSLIVLSACSTPPAPAATPTPQPTETLEPRITPTMYPYVILSEPFICGDGITDISTNASFNGLFKPNGFDQYHGHMDIYLPDGCDFTKDKMFSPIDGFVTKYSLPPDEAGEGWGYDITFPKGVYPAGIENAFIFSGISNFKISQVNKINISIGHVNCKEGAVSAGEPICSIIPMPAKFGKTRMAMQIGIDLVDGRGFMFSPTLFQWSGEKWSCDRVPRDSYCEPRPNFYRPGIK